MRITSPQKASETSEGATSTTYQSDLHQKASSCQTFHQNSCSWSNLCFEYSSNPLCCHLSNWPEKEPFSIASVSKYSWKRNHSFSNFHHFSYIALNFRIKKAELCFFKLNTNYGSFCVFSTLKPLNVLHVELARFVSKSNWSIPRNLPEALLTFTYPLLPRPN